MIHALLQFLFGDISSRQYRTVRYAFHIIILSAIVAGLANVSSTNQSYITLTPSKKTVAEGEEFSIDVIATVHVPVNAVDLVVSYPESKVSIQGIDTGTSVITLWTQEPYAENGSVYMRGGTFRKGFIGEHTIARINAKAVQKGDVSIFVKDSQLVAGDGEGSVVSVSENQSSDEAQIIVMGEDGNITGEAELSIMTDTDGDGDVDIVDVSAFMSAWFTKEYTYDFNNDGKMTFRDFSIILADSFKK